ncbi:hypothetical protein MBLNU13_g09521t1 [Cladosporium sp. NU13]
MKVSQIVASSATLILQAHACVRLRVDRSTHDRFYTIEDVKLYDNDEPIKTLPYPIHYLRSGEENDVSVGDYRAILQYKDGRPHPYGGRITYPNGYSNDLQGKTQTHYVDDKGQWHDVYCFSDNYSNCGDYYCGV